VILALAMAYQVIAENTAAATAVAVPQEKKAGALNEPGSNGTAKVTGVAKTDSKKVTVLPYNPEKESPVTPTTSKASQGGKVAVPASGSPSGNSTVVSGSSSAQSEGRVNISSQPSASSNSTSMAESSSSQHGGKVEVPAFDSVDTQQGDKATAVALPAETEPLRQESKASDKGISVNVGKDSRSPVAIKPTNEEKSGSESGSPAPVQQKERKSLVTIILSWFKR